VRGACGDRFAEVSCLRASPISFLPDLAKQGIKTFCRSDSNPRESILKTHGLIIIAATAIVCTLGSAPHAVADDCRIGEHFPVSASESYDYDNFGFSASLDGDLTIVGALGQEAAFV